MRREDWYSCDGYKQLTAEVAQQDRAYIRPSRRGLLVGLGLSSLAWALPRTALSQISINPERGTRNIIVSIFLRGGADGLNIVAPYGDDLYHRARPTIGVKKKDLHDLDGYFGLNRQLAPLLPLYQNGNLAIVHAVGSADQTRSHFEAMNTMERGLAGGTAGDASGWIARYLSQTDPAKATPLRAIAFGGTMPDSLRGSNAIAVQGIEDFKLDLEEAQGFQAVLKSLYGGGKDAMSQAGHETLQVIETLNRLDIKNYRASNGAQYPKSDLGKALQQVAFLVRADVGLEIAVLDKNGWDTHVAQGGLLPLLLDDLGLALAAFAADLGPELSRVTVVVQTEFGRRLEENSGAGTDHGRASCMFVMGGGVKGGQVYSTWPGLREEQLEGPGDLRVTTDYRDILSQVLRAKTTALPETVFGSRPTANFSLFARSQLLSNEI